MGRHNLSFSIFFFFILFIAFSSFPLVRSGDGEALLALKSSLDPLNSLPWGESNSGSGSGSGSYFCSWKGVKECMNGRVTKLVLEYLNLSGNLEMKIMNQLDQLRVLSFKGNSLSGDIPSLSGLVNLKSLYLNNNNFSGEFPASLSGLHRLKIIVLAGNQISGPVPDSLLNLSRLYMLYLQDNRFTGKIPPLNQASLRFFNVSNNQLSGEIPATPALVRFNFSSYSGNVDLCGEEIQKPCGNGSEPVVIPPSNPKKSGNRKIIAIAVSAGVGGFLLLLVFMLCLYIICSKGSNANDQEEVSRKNQVVTAEGAAPHGGSSGINGGKGGNGFSWEGEGLGTLVFLGTGEDQMNYSLEDLLKASAETLGRGTLGSTYKAVMESGFIVTVKRLKDARYPRLEEFRRQVDLLGRLRHPNLVPLRAYFQAKEERLLVYDYFPNGSLFSLIHGSGTKGGGSASGSGKPLHWTSCLKIAEDLAAGLAYIHQNPGLTHGNLKSSNVLLGPEFESCLTDFGLASFQDPNSVDHPTVSYKVRAPESTHNPTQQADVYSFGVLLLELLTGKTPFQDLVWDHGSDIPHWVRSVRDQETDSGDEQEKLDALLNIAVACVSPTPENRPLMKEVLKMIRDARAEVQVSSNSSDHSPGRWSDTVQSLPREEHLSI